MADREVLVLEPDKKAAVRIAQHLARSDFVAVSCKSVKDALRHERWPRVTAVVADVKVLARGARRPSAAKLRESIKQLRHAQEEYHTGGQVRRRLYVIVMSEEEQLSEHEAAIEAGADLYLSEEAATDAGLVGTYLSRMLEPRAAEAAAEPIASWTDVFRLPTARLRGTSGRLNATLIADALGVTLKRLADALGVAYTTVHKTPDSEALQPALQPFANVLAMLEQVFGGNEASVRAWLQAERDVLGNKTPLQAMLEPRGVAGVEQFVAGAWLGEPD